MAIWVDDNTRVLVQGITGAAGRFHVQQMLQYGTQIVAGVTPGKGGQSVEQVPVFDTVQQAVDGTQANTSIVYVPAPMAADAVLEAAAANIKLIICITEGIPVVDMLRVQRQLRGSGTRLIGPNCPGIITPAARCKVGIMPASIHQQGHVGVVSRSGTLTYEAVDQLTKLGLGQSSCVGIGGDPIIGTSFVDVLAAFYQDAQTHAVVMIGEIGGSAEQQAAAWLQQHAMQGGKLSKPVVGFVAGSTAPAGRRMGHAGAIVAGSEGTAAQKSEQLTQAGVVMVDNPAEIGSTMQRLLQN